MEDLLSAIGSVNDGRLQKRFIQRHKGRIVDDAVHADCLPYVCNSQDPRPVFSLGIPRNRFTAKELNDGVQQAIAG